MKLLLFAAVFLLISCFSCKDKNPDPNSILGKWQVEDRGTSSGTTHYQVFIIRSDYDTAMYIINNFYRLSMETDVYVSLHDSTLTIGSQMINNEIMVSGTGHVSSDKSTIQWDYQVSQGNNTDVVVSTYIR